MDKKVEISKAANKLFFKYGIRAVTMAEIAKELGMSKKTLYENFNSKKDLLQEVIQVRIKNDKEEIDQIRNQGLDAISEMYEIANHVFQHLSELPKGILYELKKYNKEIFQSIHNYHRDHLLETVADNIYQGIEQGVYREDVIPEVVAALYFQKVRAILEPEFLKESLPVQSLFTQAFLYHMHGIVNSKGKKIVETKIIGNE